MTATPNMTALEIINEFENVYVKHPENRAVNDMGGCEYFNYETGNKCAVGRCFNDGALNEYGSSGHSAFQIHVYQQPLDNLLKEKYKGHDVDFWVELQALHDDKINWKENNQGMTNSGLEELENLKKEWS